jgi:hypothetical protein
MPEFTVCYTIKVEGTITVTAEDLDDAKGRVEKRSVSEMLKEGDTQFDEVTADDGWEG